MGNMETAGIEKYRIDHLDCAACAARIEARIRQLEGVAYAAIDFASQTLRVQTDDMENVVAHVRAIEPSLELTPMAQFAGSETAGKAHMDYPIGRELAILSASVLFFAGALIVEYRFSDHTLAAFFLPFMMAAYFLAGWKVFAAAWRTLRRGGFFDENLLMVIATGGAIAISAYDEAVAVMLFYKVGEMLQAMAVSRSRRSIRALLDAKPDRAWLQTEEGLRQLSPEAVPVGASIVVRPGEKIPLDGKVIEGRSLVDGAALTGESVPLSVGPGDEVLAGQICQNGALTLKVVRPFASSSIAKVMTLVEDATARKAKTERFITTFARYYTPAVVVSAAAIAAIPPLLTGDAFTVWLYRALVLLVISCPCALVVSIPLGYFGGIGRASRRGILVKGANFLDSLAAVKQVVFDKTGTLTQGVFAIREVVSLNGFSRSQLLEMAAAAECRSNHPIAGAIVAAYEKSGGRIASLASVEHAEQPGRGVSATFKNRRVLVGSDTLMHQHAIAHHRCEWGATVAHIAVDGTYAGYITIGDELKPDAVEAVRDLKKIGVEHVGMLTGDNGCVAEAVARRLRLDSFRAGLLPEEKVEALEQIQREHRGHGKMAYVGDGINDAPVIARADVGVAMGALGADAAVETADVVLMTDSPRKMAEALSIARLTRRIVWQNIVLAFVVKAIFLGFGAVGLASMWEAVFADVGTALLAVANSARIVGERPHSTPMGV